MPLSKTEFMKCSSLLPMAVPAVGIALELALWSFGIRVPDWFEDWTGIALGSVLYFTPVYLLVVGAMLVFLIGRSLRTHVAAAVAMPQAMAVTVEGVLALMSGDPLGWSSFAWMACTRPGASGAFSPLALLADTACTYRSGR